MKSTFPAAARRPPRLWLAVYRLALLLARPLVLLRLRLRARREPEYGRRVAERFGEVPEGIPRGVIWFHTVSAGETIAAAPLISALVELFPDLPFLVTTMTPTGSAQVTARLGGRVHHCYAPYDFPDAVRRFYDRVEPRMLVLMETELWPTLLGVANDRGIPAMLVNARLSERSARGYARVGGLIRSMVEQLSLIACQYPAHASRFIALGAAPERVQVLGSVKFDAELPADHQARCSRLNDRFGLAGRAVWIAGSTHEGEEAIVLRAHAHLLERFPDAVLILVPRHPARADAVAELIAQAGRTLLRTGESATTLPAAIPGDAAANRAPVEVVLGDRMGELLYLYGLADVAFIGGSLVPVGGHNPIEAAVWGRPLLMGPHRFNFTDVADAFAQENCLSTVTDAQTLGDAVARYFTDPQSCRSDGLRALGVVQRNRGTTDRLLTLLRNWIRQVCIS
ncbi:MAG: lipid IV(A) 3-deoxy-D-manno-octulosonic acid transferase [Pseudomonadales bacterium]|nr:lipid IV(A) 3-deoxy-D-manno-octulosonic acid transferase [Pseudomonadales bacterium]